MLSDRNKVVRGVLAFLAGCAVLGFVMGLRGAMPAPEPDYDAGSPLSTTSGVVVDAAPMQDLPAQAVQEDPAAKEEEDEEAAEAEEEAAEPPAPEPKREAPPPVPTPKEEPPPADPVGDIIAAPPPAALDNLY